MLDDEFMYKMKSYAISREEAQMRIKQFLRS